MIKRIAAWLGALALAVTALVGIGASAALATCSTCYYYAVGSQDVSTFSPAVTGLNVNIDVYKPTVNTAKGGIHSLAQMDIEDTAGANRVEFGWNVDPGLYGDSNTHLFTHYTVNNVSGGYNSGVVHGAGTACAAATTIPVAPGDTILTTTTPLTLKAFSVQHFVTGGLGAWWISYNSAWVGCLPDTLWTAASQTFVDADYVQVFGEVASSHDYASGAGVKPCDQMGSGVSPAVTTTGAARFGNTTYVGNTTVPTLFIRGAAGSGTPDPDYTVSAVNTRSFYFGGHTTATSPTC
jgi:hypothetical protein